METPIPSSAVPPERVAYAPPEPPTMARAVWLMTAMHLRRWSARAVTQLNRTREKKASEGEPRRRATPRKMGGRLPLLVLLGLLMGVSSLNICRQFVVNLGAELEVPKSAILPDSQIERMVVQHQARRGTRFQNVMSLQPIWPVAEYRPAMVTGLGLVLGLLAFIQFFISFGFTNKDLGKVEWHMEWLYTLPVPARTLFGGLLPGMICSDLWVWLMSGPLLLMVYYSAGWSWLSLPLAFVATLYLSLLICSLRILTETVLRLHLGASGLKNVQAVGTLFGLGLYFTMMYFVFYPDGIGTLGVVARQTPMVVLANPFSLPMAAALDGPVAWVAALLGMTAFGVVIPTAALTLAGRLVRSGLLAHTGEHQGTRRTVARPTAWRFHGIIGKELLGLARDRNLLVQVLVVPVFLFGFYFLLMPSVREFALASAGGTAALAFGFGAYSLVISAGFSLAFEGTALWLLYTLPHKLWSLLAQKAALWSVLALLYTVGTLLGGIYLKPEVAADLLVPGLFAVLGVPLMGAIASGLGALSTDPFQTDMQRRVRPEFQYLYLLVGGIYGTNLVLPDLWPKIATATLVIFVAIAVWQQVIDRLPFLLDPTALPPRQVTLADGLVAALAFQGLQLIGSLILINAGLDPAQTIVIAFAASGFLVVGFSLAAFYSAKMPHILAAVGLRGGNTTKTEAVSRVIVPSPPPPPSPTRGEGVGRATSSLTWALLAGVGGGVFAAGIGLGYLFLVHHFHEVAPEQTSQPQVGDGNIWWLFLLGVVAAPLFEEFIFRGLVYRGLRRTFSVPVAVVLSAAVFALVHPPLAVAPVFVLGLVAAAVFERTGLLLAPILTHALYNAAVIFLSSWTLT